MVQKSSPYLNKSGYSMFWNSMWDNKNSFSKNMQLDFFTKSFINYFFSDFLYNNILNKLDIKNNNSLNLNHFYNFNSNNNKKLVLSKYFNNCYNSEITISKIWFFKFQNWIILYFFIFNKNNSFFFKNLLKKKYTNKDYYIYTYLNNFKKNKFKINKHYLISYFFNKNNF